MVQQQRIDHEFMDVLKSAMLSLHETSETQRLAVQSQEMKIDEQAAAILRLMKDCAELRGACTQNALRICTNQNEILESVRGKDMVELVEASWET